MEHADRSGGGTVDLVGLVIEPFDVFYRRELRPVVGLAYVLTGRRSAAEDLAQEAFVAAYRRWRDIGGYDDPGAWVRAVAMNHARSRVRRRATEARALVRLFHVGRGIEAGQTWGEREQVAHVVELFDRAVAS